MRRKSDSFLVLSTSLITLVLMSVFAAPPVSKAAFTTFEQYGPNVNQLLIMLYASQQAEFNAFELGAIDMVDSPLNAYWINRWTGNADIVMQDGEYGDFAIREFDINVAETRGLVTPAGTDHLVMQPNIGANLAFRQAVAYLVDRTYIITAILGGLGVPVYTMVPPTLGGYANNNVNKYLYSPSSAAAVLAAGDIHDTDGDGYFDWPGTPWGSSNRTLVDFVVRIDDTPGRKEAGQRLIWEMTTNIRAYSGGVGFYVQEWDAWGSVGARKWALASPGGFVIYTGGWLLDRDPDLLFDLYHSSMYWAPGRPPNYAWVHDPVLDGYLEGIRFGESAASVMINVQAAQARMADMAWNIPAWSPSAPKAIRAIYTGGTNGVPNGDAEDQYRGKAWQGFVNQLGKGLNSWFGTLDAHVNDAGGDPMSGGVLRYGFMYPEVNSFNPVYSEWVWDWEVLGRTYDTMLAVNPYNLAEDLEWLAQRWEVGVWTGPYGEATKLIFTLRNDVYWHDGARLTADDVIFTIKDLATILDTRDLPPPWYYSNVLDVNSITKLSQFQVEVKMNSKSYFALHWIGGIPLLPEHIWRSIVTSGDPTTFAPDQNIIGTGPFKVYPHSIAEAAGDYYVPNQYIRLDAYQRANKATVPEPGNLGYFNEDPIRITKAVHGSKIVVTVENWAKVPIEVNPVTLQVGANTLTQGPFAVPVGTGTGNTPGVVLLAFDVSSVSAQTYTITANATYSFEGKSWTCASNDPITLSLPAKLGDVNSDGQVSVLDAIHLSLHFGLKAFVWPEDDISCDNTINTQDALVLLTNWGT